MKTPNKKQTPSEKEMENILNNGTTKQKQKVILTLLKEELKPYSYFFFSAKTKQDFLNDQFHKILEKLKGF